MSERKTDSFEFENELRDKVDELASTVDCFDKICSKAFPEQGRGYSDCEYTVCDVENVTGKRTFFRFVPALTAVAVLAVCIFLVPKGSGFIDNVFSDKGKQENEKSFRAVIAEMNEETKNGSYSYYDCPLSVLVKNDILASPLFGCPFEDKAEEAIKVRVFVKMYAGLPTNQVYAVEYKGDFEDADYLAVAETGVDFSEEELKAAVVEWVGEDAAITSISSEQIIPDIKNHTLEFAENKFSVNDEGVLTDTDGTPCSVASYTYNSIYKHNGEIYFLSSETLYYSEINGEEGVYSYDICSAYNDDGTLARFDSMLFEDAWKNVVYYNGESAAPENGESGFRRADEFGNFGFEDSFLYDIFFAEPKHYRDLVEDENEIENYQTGITMSVGTDKVAETAFPINKDICEYMRIYFPSSTKTVYLNYASPELSSEIIMSDDYSAELENEWDAEGERFLLMKYVGAEREQDATEDMTASTDTDDIYEYEGEGNVMEAETQNQADELRENELEIYEVEAYIKQLKTQLAYAQSHYWAASASHDEEQKRLHEKEIYKYSYALEEAYDRLEMLTK